MNRMIAKTLAISVVGSLCLCLAACDGGGTSATGPQGEKPREADERAKIQAPGGEPGDTASTGTQAPR